MKTLGLCMIVKNESKVIRRCLESARPLVDYVLVEDTGSSDGTQATIRDWLSSVGLSGEIYDESWRDFAYNRSHVLAKLRQNKSIDYAFMLDADDHIVFDANFDIALFKNSLSHDLYDVELRSGRASYLRPQICSNRHEFHYRGVLHEFLQEPRSRSTRGKITGFYISSTREGARSKDPEKYRKDAALLENALRTERDEFLRSRYTFYLARSYEDAGDKELALKAFLRRATLGHWTEEIFMSLYSAGHLEEQLGRPVEDVIARFMRASKVAPTRAEALHAASKVCREHKRFAEGYDYARRGLAIALPSNGLFVVPWIYDYGLLDEFAVNAYWSERYEDCLEACERLLREGKIPADIRERVENNGRFAREHLTKKESAKAVDSVGKADEVFVSLHNAAERLRMAGRPFEEVIAAYDRASNAALNRAEALHDASRFCRWNNKFAEGYEYARRGLTVPPPSGGSCVQKWIYDYGLLDELAVNAYWVERYQECLDACERLLREGKIPPDMHDRVKENAEFAAEKIRLQGDRSGARLEPTAKARTTGETDYPRVLLAILAKQAEHVLPFYLFCIEALDYPKTSISLYVRTNNNTDRTADFLREWIARVRDQYEHIEFDASEVPESVGQFAVHEWNATRFKILARLRQESMNRALENECKYYFVVDADNFLKPNTLRDLIDVGLPIVAPLLRCTGQHPRYSNFHEKVDARGYFIQSEEYYWLLDQRIKGLCQVPVVHCTYLVRSDVISRLSYNDGSDRHEYVIFSESARTSGIPQYLDTREIYGYLTLDDDAGEAMTLLGPQIGAQILARKRSDKPRIFCCFGLHSSGSTWMFNLIREICRIHGVDFVSLHHDSEAHLPWDVLGSRLIVVKSPNPLASFQSFIADSGEPAVITVRDPRDALVSFMQRFPNSLATSFDEALRAIVLSAQSLVALSRLRQFPIFRYEDGFVGSSETFDRVAALLATNPAAEDRAAILAQLTPEAVRRTISDLTASGAIQGEKIWDTGTHWHANHVGDGKVGKFASVLSRDQQHEILFQTREFCDCFGYDTTIMPIAERHSNAFLTST
jgi:glycosyltransferase involved in cell wall biosynthesis